MVVWWVAERAVQYSTGAGLLPAASRGSIARRRGYPRTEKGLLGSLVSFPRGLDVGVASVQPPTLAAEFSFVLDVGHRSRSGFAVVRGIPRFLPELDNTALAVGDSAGSACAAVVAVHVLLLLGEDEDLPPFLRCEPELVENGVLVVALVLIDLHQFLRLVLPAKLDGTALRAAGVVAQNLRIGPYLAGSKGDAAAAAVVRRRILQ